MRYRVVEGTGGQYFMVRNPFAATLEEAKIIQGHSGRNSHIQERKIKRDGSQVWKTLKTD